MGDSGYSGDTYISYFKVAFINGGQCQLLYAIPYCRCTGS